MIRENEMVLFTDAVHVFLMLQEIIGPADSQERIFRKKQWRSKAECFDDDDQ